MSSNYPVPPPSYQDGTQAETSNANAEAEAPLLQPGEGAPARTEGDNVPDDFKYSTSVAECALPIRHAFVRKVYTILSGQLLATAVAAAVIIMNKGIQQWALNNMWMFWVSLVGSIGLMIGAFLTQRSYPMNMLFLGGFTLCESYLIGMVSSLYDTHVVLQAAAITMTVFIGLTVFAMQTKYDMTGWQFYLSAALWGLIGFGFVSLFVPFGSGAELAYSVIGAIIFSGYILVDTQLIMRKYHPEDEVAAAISLYLDVINLFLNILRILSEANDN